MEYWEINNLFMKYRQKIIVVLVFLVALNFSQLALANIADGLIFKPAFTVEYQGMGIDGSGQNGRFKSRSFGNQLKNFNNIALGMNFRVHQYLGFNINWAKNDLDNSGLSGYDLDKKAHLSIKNTNISSLVYFPIIGDSWLEGFGEVGVSNVNSNLKFLQVDGTLINQSKHENVLLYGAGIQFMPYDMDVAFRLGFQKYNTNLWLNTKMTTFRGGVVVPF